MRMFRRCLALLVAAALVLGAAGASAVAACAAPVDFVAAPGAAGNDCQGCGTGEQGQVPPGCAAVACMSACTAGPMGAASEPPLLNRPVSATARAAAAPADGTFARAIPPDLPPPR